MAALGGTARTSGTMGVVQKKPDFDPRGSEGGLIRRDGQVARSHKLTSGGRGQSLHSRNHGLPQSARPSITRVQSAKSSRYASSVCPTIRSGRAPTKDRPVRRQHDDPGGTNRPILSSARSNSPRARAKVRLAFGPVHSQSDDAAIGFHQQSSGQVRFLPARPLGCHFASTNTDYFASSMAQHAHAFTFMRNSRFEMACPDSLERLSESRDT